MPPEKEQIIACDIADLETDQLLEVYSDLSSKEKGLALSYVLRMVAFELLMRLEIDQIPLVFESKAVRRAFRRTEPTRVASND